ncbi:hypothetical protein AJ87_24075 [Rhizobium yanglingense]|nr:hypothetical protein AJ87_24075 [Rhizobium yanglingense]
MNDVPLSSRDRMQHGSRRGCRHGLPGQPLDAAEAARDMAEECFMIKIVGRDFHSIGVNGQMIWSARGRSRARHAVTQVVMGKETHVDRRRIAPQKIGGSKANTRHGVGDVSDADGRRQALGGECRVDDIGIGRVDDDSVTFCKPDSFHQPADKHHMHRRPNAATGSIQALKGFLRQLGDHPP